jgi:general stress protein 26
MSETDRVDFYLAAAAQVVANTRYCWLATSGEAGAVSARPMGRTPQKRGEDWIFRFVTDSRTRKIDEIGLGGRVAVIVQREAEDAYVALAGEVAVRPRAREDAEHWRDGYRVYFPGPGEERHAAFLEVRVDRIELWIRGVTPEPWGQRPTVLARDAAGGWREAGDSQLLSVESAAT